MNWYYEHAGASIGPISLAEFARLRATGAIRDSTLVWCDGMTEWEPAHAVLPIEAETPPADSSRSDLREPFISGIEWLPVAFVLATPWLSTQYLVSLEGMRDPALQIAMIANTASAVVFAVVFGLYFAIRLASTGRRPRPTAARVFRETVWVFALLEALLALAFVISTSRASGFGSRQDEQIQAVNHAAVFFFLSLTAIGVVGWIRERSVYAYSGYQR
jgi:hypothetical protein